MEVEQATVANSEPAEVVALLHDPKSAESPVHASPALEAAFQDTLERVSGEVQERPRKARIVSQGVEVEPVTAKGVDELLADPYDFSL